MKKQGISPAKKIKCGLWDKKERRFITIKEFNKLKKQKGFESNLSIEPFNSLDKFYGR